MHGGLLAVVALLAADVTASVSFMPNDAAPGGYYFYTVVKLYNFDTTKATSRLEMTLPSGLWMAVPEDQPGWQPTVTQRTIPETVIQGRPSTSEPGKIVWQAAPGHQLAAGGLAQFGLQLKFGCTFNSAEFHSQPAGTLPRLYFPTREILSDPLIGNGLGEDKVVTNDKVPVNGAESGGHHTRSLARNIEFSDWVNCPNSELNWYGTMVESPPVATILTETQVRSLAAAEVELFNVNITGAVAAQETLADDTSALVSEASGKISTLELLLASGLGDEALTSTNALFVTAAVFSFFGTSVIIFGALLRLVAPAQFRNLFVPVV